MKIERKSCLALMLLGLLALSACGKKGAPTPVGPAQDVTYPRSYPAK